MRTAILALMLIGLVPLAIVQPWTGILTWTWISVMNPHKLTFGFLRDFPVAAIVGGAVLIGLVITKDRRMPPLNGVTCTLLLFVLWMCVTSLFAVHPDQIGVMFSKVMKIQLMIFVTMALLYTRAHLQLFVWVITLSLGFYGVKGGIYTLMNGGTGKVFGPPGGFTEGNNELALALTMSIPLMYYLRAMASRVWVRHLFLLMMMLTALSILGSQSRGAFLAIVAMSVYLWRHSERKLIFGVILVAIALGLLAFMPLAWESRMHTITEYERDGSAQGRINAWWMAFNLARSRLFGGGFEVATADLFARYAPDPLNIRAAHSIYFQVLGEHGFFGLALFLLFWILTWRTAGWVFRTARDIPDMEWASRLAAMVQVTMVGYFVGGAFLSLAYFDLPYDLMVIVVMLRALIERDQKSTDSSAPVSPRESGGLAQIHTTSKAGTVTTRN